MNDNVESIRQSPANGPQSSLTADAQQQMRVRWMLLIGGLMIVALSLRITAAVLVDRQAQRMGQNFLIEGDANGYWELGQKIASGKDYSLYSPPRRVLRVPGFPLLLAASIRMFGDEILPARLLLACVGTVCCWLTYQLGAILHTQRVGFWAAVFVAANPLHVVNCVLILSETWFTLWMLLSLIGLVWLIDGYQSRRSESSVPCRWKLSRNAVFVGGLLGATSLVRPGFLPWVGISVVAVLLFMKMPQRSAEEERSAVESAVRVSLATRLLVASALLTGCLLVMLPWAARNASVTGHWVWTSLWSGPSMYDGLNPGATGASDMQFFEDDFVMQRMSEFEMNQHYKNKAIEYATQNPGKAIELAFRKAALFLMPVPNALDRRGWGVWVACVVLWLLLVGNVFAGLRSRQWDGLGLLVMTGPLLMFLLVHMVFVGSVRYRLPLEFPLSVLAAIGWRSWALNRGSSLPTSTIDVSPG